MPKYEFCLYVFYLLLGVGGGMFGFIETVKELVGA